MPRIADTFVARQQTQVPGIRALFETEQLSKLVLAHAKEGIRQIDLQPAYVRLKPGASCLVAYRGQADGRSFRCYAKAHSWDNALKLDKARSRVEVPGPLGPGRIVAPAQLLVINFFPNDVILRPLRRTLLNDPDLRILAYKPERRFVGLAESEDGRREVLKIYKKPAFPKALRLATAANGIAFFPDLVGADERSQSLRLDWIDGETLTDTIQSGNHPIEAAQMAGTALARFHQLEPPQALRSISTQDDCRRIHAIQQGIAETLPELSERACYLGDHLVDALGRLPVAKTLVHGDFYANQIVYSANGIRFLDFDELALAAPESDIGLFIAHLEYDILRRRIDEKACRQLTESFLSGYRMIRDLDLQSVRLYTAFGMFQLAHRPFRDVLPNWPAETARWIDLIERYLEQKRDVSSGGRPASLSGIPEQSAVIMPQLGDAMRNPDGVRRVEHALRCVLPEYRELVCNDVRLLRYKVGRRALVEYALAESSGEKPIRVIGKIRAKGLDKKTFKVNQSLFTELQTRRTPGELRVPRPLATIPDLHMWLQERVAGRNGWSALIELDPDRMARRIAQALHEFHESGLAVGRQHLWIDELSVLDSRLDAVEQRSPQLHKRIRDLRAGCHMLALQLEGRPLKCIHRDFYPDQLVVTDSAVYFLDLDLACSGDPAVDVGNFLAHIQESDLRTYQDPNARHPVLRQLLTAYQELAGDDDLVRAVDIYRVLTLARHIDISHNFEDRRRFSDEILAFTERELERACMLYLPPRQFKENNT